MKKILSGVGLVLATVACGTNRMLPIDNLISPTPTATPTPPHSELPPDTQEPPTGPKGQLPFVRPCLLVEETTFNASTDKTIWQPSHYFTPAADANVSFDEYGLSLSGPRSGVTFFPTERDLTICPSMAFRVRGTINFQSLAGAGYDNREAPIAVMIQYTDINGLRHSSLRAFNEGESDDRNTTRMFWFGFGYLDTTTTFGFSNFVPSIIPVEQGVPFDVTVDFFEKLGRTVKTIHSITLEGSGWSMCSTITDFAMKPKEAFQDPSAPYRP
jgi:hypothetical protein